MLIKIVCIGKTKKKWLQDGEAEYIKHLKKYATVEWVVIEPETRGTVADIVKKETEKVQKYAQTLSDFELCVLDIYGDQYSSESFSDKIKTFEKKGKIAFFIGGSHGFALGFTDSITYKISLSPMTFVHEMVRVVLLEQLFRALDIMHGGQYHK